MNIHLCYVKIGGAVSLKRKVKYNILIYMLGNIFYFYEFDIKLFKNSIKFERRTTLFKHGQ